MPCLHERKAGSQCIRKIFFRMNNNSVTMDAKNHFATRIQKCNVDVNVSTAYIYIDIVVLSEIFSESKTQSNKLINFNLVQNFKADGYGGAAIALIKK